MARPRADAGLQDARLDQLLSGQGAGQAPAPEGAEARALPLPVTGRGAKAA